MLKLFILKFKKPEAIITLPPRCGHRKFVHFNGNIKLDEDVFIHKLTHLKIIKI